MNTSNRIKKAFAAQRGEKATKKSHKKDMGCLVIACLFIIMAALTLFKIFI